LEDIAMELVRIIERLKELLEKIDKEVEKSSSG
jgi:hypothetical protein